MKRVFVYMLFLCSFMTVCAQNFNAENTALAKFVERMYSSTPFQGVKLLEDYDNRYLLTIILLDPAKYGNNESTMNRVASTKAMSEASRFFNGSKITSELIITTREDGCQNITTEMLEKINEQSIGYVNALSQLTNFSDSQGLRVFVYYKQLEVLVKSKNKANKKK